VKRLLAAATLALAAPLPAVAQAAGQGCELHVWTTNSYYAVFHGAQVGWSGYGAVVTGTTLTPIDGVGGLISQNLTPADQEAVIRGFIPASAPMFNGYTLVFHQAEGLGRHSNWVDKNVGAGGRDVASDSPCYAELHVIFVTLFRTAISKKIQTAFLYREFGASPTMTRKAVDAGSTGAPAFPAKSEAEAGQASRDLQAAFRENLAIFLRKKKVLGTRT